MGGYESKEYERLVGRNFKDYSLGHRRMYLKAIEAIAAGKGESRVLEAGFGIGYGLKEMGLAGILESYVGYEPNFDSFNWTQANMSGWIGIPAGRTLLLNMGFEVPALNPKFDDVFCIEVIEHVPESGHLDFIRNLGTVLAPEGTLWFSTPDKIKAPKEGVRLTGEWVQMLHDAGFASVLVDVSEWTHLFRCEGFKP